MEKGNIPRKTFVKGIAAGGIAIATLGILQVGEYTLEQKTGKNEIGPGSTYSTDAPKGSAETASVMPASLTPGTYTATAPGISSDITVTCTFDESGITEMTADVSGETAGLGADIGDTMIEQILAAQSANVDGVSGCTITADAIKAAVAECIAQASGGESGAENPDSQEASSELSTEAANAEAQTDASSESGNAEAQAEVSSENGNAPAEAASAGAGVFTPGTYMATASGISSDVTVTCTFDVSGITEMSVDVSGETAGLGADIGDTMIEQFLAAQSSEVEGVSGCTITADALKAAVADCMAQASSSVPAGASETELETAASDETEVSAELTEVTELEPGTYMATAKGMVSDITVTCIFGDSSITEVITNVSGETDGIGAAIGDMMARRFLETQSAEVDGISGATVTSDALKAAVADCISQAETDGIELKVPKTEEAVETVTEAVSEEETEAAPETEAVSEASEEETENPNAVSYTASAKGMESDVTVTCTFDGTDMIAMTADVSGETDGIGAAIGDMMAKRVLEAQSAEVDGVSGATITSDAIKTAVGECLAQAGVTTEGSAEASDAESENSIGADDASAGQSATAYTPGTYTATAKGMESDVTVTCTFDETGITEVTADVSGETQGIGAAIGDMMVKRILEAQSDEFDGVSGATITSDAVKAAVADCIAQATA